MVKFIDWLRKKLDSSYSSNTSEQITQILGKKFNTSMVTYTYPNLDVDQAMAFVLATWVASRYFESKRNNH